MTEITWPFDVSVFRSSAYSRQKYHLAGVFKVLLSGERFRKTPFSVTENAVLVWTVDQTREKKMHFQIYLTGTERLRSMMPFVKLELHRKKIKIKEERRMVILITLYILA